MVSEHQIWKFLAGKLSPQEEDEVIRWYNVNAAHQKYFNELKAIWTTTAHSEIDRYVDEEKDFDAILSRIEGNGTRNQPVQKRTVVLKRFFRVAAVIVLLYSLSLSYYTFNKDENERFTEVRTQRGKQTEIFLPDGTHVWLNAESSLRYPHHLLKNKVDIFLEGEAYFEVTKLDGRNFTVNAKAVEITVQGTSFNVKAYKNDKAIETTLDEGKITVTKKRESARAFKPVILQPNQRLVINPVNNVYQLTNLSANKDSAIFNKENVARDICMKKGSSVYTAWKEGLLIFKNKRFEDLTKELERWYDVQIALTAPELKGARYTGVFEKETLETALKALSLSLPFNYTITPDSVWISPIVPNESTYKTNLPME